MPAQPLITWSEPLEQLVSFAGSFLVAGAIGFRLTAARTLATDPKESEFLGVARRRAATMGTIGAAIGLIFVLTGLPTAAARAHESVSQLLASDVTNSLAVVCSALVLIALGSAAANARAGWPIAVFALAAGTLAPILGGHWTSVVNPIHRLAAGLWLGTLFVMVTCGLTPLLGHPELRDRRGALAAGMVNRFSPVALSMGGVVVTFGVITAWRHLPTLASLWESPYGQTLIVKLLLVAAVFGLGAFNWRRQRPRLGHESAAISLRRSSRVELSVAALVLIITAILVSLPSPKRAPTPRPATTATPATKN
jgi:putative copper export protein